MLRPPLSFDQRCARGECTQRSKDWHLPLLAPGGSDLLLILDVVSPAGTSADVWCWMALIAKITYQVPGFWGLQPNFFKLKLCLFFFTINYVIISLVRRPLHL